MPLKIAFFTFLILGLGLSNILAQEIIRSAPSQGGTLNGSAVSLPKPVYPAAAQAVRAGGAVNVQVMIDEEGSVISASAVSGHPLLRQAAEQAARQAKFKPTLLSGQPVKVNGVIVYNFVPAPLPADDSAENGDRPDGLKPITKPILNDLATELVKPDYPSAARAVGAMGAVNVRVLIDEDGNVSTAEAVSGHPLLRAAAVNAALLSKFKPTILDGKPVKNSGVVVFTFIAPAIESSTGTVGSDDQPTNAEKPSDRVINGKALSMPKPDYPKEARKERARGAVNVKVLIDEEGNVISAKAVSGHELLRGAAEEAARGAKFQPTLFRGKPVKVDGVIVYNFEP